MGSRLRGLGRRAADLVRARPALATALTGLISGGVGDTMAQVWGNHCAAKTQGSNAGESGEEEHAGSAVFSMRRVLGVAAFQATMSPLLYLPLYSWLDRRFGTKTTLRSLVAKVVVDDFIFVPGVELPSFLIVTATVEGANVKDRFLREYRDCTLACWFFNVPVTIINFTLVPPPFRVIVLDVAECIITCLLSLLSHRESSGENGPGQERGIVDRRICMY